MKILSIDQASRVSGWALFENSQLIEFGKVEFNEDEFIKRASYLRQWLNDFIDDKEIDKVILEDIQMQLEVETRQKVYGEGNIVNVETFKKLAGLQGILHELCIQKEVPVEIYHSSVWKSTCGIKGAHRTEQKKNAQDYIFNKYGVKVIQDIADAVCLGEHACNGNVVKPILEFKEVNYAPMNWD